MNKVVGLGLAAAGAGLLYYFFTSSQTPGETAGEDSSGGADASPTTKAVNPTQAQILAAIRAQSGPLTQFPATQTYDQWNYWAQLAGFAIIAFEDAMPAGSDRNAAISFDRWITSRAVGLHGIGNLRGLYAV